MKGLEFWNTRYQAEGFVFGTEANDFLRSSAPRIPKGRVLCLAEGEGRNAVHLAGLGFQVQAVDQSSAGLEKAARLAALRKVSIETTVADLSAFPITPAEWSGIISIFVHLPPGLRKELHQRVVSGLRSGGVYVLEAYTPRQLAYGTGGPKEAELLVTLEALRIELTGLHFLIGQEIERPVIEGSGHTGLASVVQVLAVKP